MKNKITVHLTAHLKCSECSAPKRPLCLGVIWDKLTIDGQREFNVNKIAVYISNALSEGNAVGLHCVLVFQFVNNLLC